MLRFVLAFIAAWLTFVGMMFLASGVTAPESLKGLWAAVIVAAPFVSFWLVLRGLRRTRTS